MTSEIQSSTDYAYIVSYFYLTLDFNSGVRMKNFQNIRDL